MDSKVKKALIISGSLIGLIGLGLLIKNAFSKDDSDDTDTRTAAEKAKDLITGKGDSASTDVVGNTVNYLPTEGYVNVRSSAEVDNSIADSGWTFDFTSNMLAKVKQNPVGKVISLVDNGDLRWYKIQLTKAIDGVSIGYVREDAVELAK